MRDKFIEAIEGVMADVDGLTPKRSKNVLGDKWKYINALADGLPQYDFGDGKRLAIVDDKAELPQRGINTCANCWIQTQENMVQAGYVLEVK